MIVSSSPDIQYDEFSFKKGLKAFSEKKNSTDKYL